MANLHNPQYQTQYSKNHKVIGIPLHSHEFFFPIQCLARRVAFKHFDLPLSHTVSLKELWSLRFYNELWWAGHTEYVIIEGKKK